MVRLQMIGLSVKSIVGLSSLALFLAQAAPALTPVDPLSSVGRLSLDGCLIIAVGVLWKANARKDEQMIGLVADMAKTMTLVIEGDREVRAGQAALLRYLADRGYRAVHP